MFALYHGLREKESAAAKQSFSMTAEIRLAIRALSAV